jgi:prepilin-type N-terminal cleavage/methylation domain-containing protein
MLQSLRARGYTLIEMLIVVGVLGLAGALLVPVFNQPNSLRAQSAVRRIIGDLSFAQADALAQQEWRRVHFFDDGSGYVLLRPPFDPDVDFIMDPLAAAGGNGAYIVNFATEDRWEGVSISAVDIDGGESFLTFDELGGTITDGNAPGTGGTITVTTDGFEYAITIAPFTGKITVAQIN